ncbi:MAG: MATE family efflux transporter [Synergistes sp.]|nr:MATE family efflux transporter [Synergistes sp.]
MFSYHFHTNGNVDLDNHVRMTEAPVGKLVASLAVPTVTSMLVTTLYNTADTYFVSQLGTSASGAVGINFSLMAIFQAIGFTLGNGAASVVALALGADDEEKAHIYASSSFFLSLALGAVLCVTGLAFLEPLMKKLGATPTILPFAKDYAAWILFGAPFICASFVMNNVLRAEGHASFAMRGLVAGGILNIFLDPIFIFVFGLGISGAAIATIVSQCVSFAVMILFFIRKKSIVRLSIKYFIHNLSVFYDIMRLGLPSLTRQGLACISTAALNVSAAVYGDAAVAGMSIVLRVVMFVFAVNIGIGQGFSPVAGYNFGAGLYSRVKEAYKVTVCADMVIMGLFSAVLWIFAPEIMKFFRDDPAVIATGISAMRFQCCVVIFHPIIVMTNMLFQFTGLAWRATLLASTRQGIYFIPLIVLLPQLFGLKGVEMIQTVADFLSFLTAVPAAVWFMKMLNKKEEERLQGSRCN